MADPGSGRHAMTPRLAELAACVLRARRQRALALGAGLAASTRPTFHLTAMSCHLFHPFLMNHRRRAMSLRNSMFAVSRAAVFRAVGIALPPNIREAEATPDH
jgi:hypothetical protein